MQQISISGPPLALSSPVGHADQGGPDGESFESLLAGLAVLPLPLPIVDAPQHPPGLTTVGGAAAAAPGEEADAGSGQPGAVTPPRLPAVTGTVARRVEAAPARVQDLPAGPAPAAGLDAAARPAIGGEPGRGAGEPAPSGGGEAAPAALAHRTPAAATVGGFAAAPERGRWLVEAKVGGRASGAAGVATASAASASGAAVGPVMADQGRLIVMAAPRTLPPQPLSSTGPIAAGIGAVLPSAVVEPPDVHPAAGLTVALPRTVTPGDGAGAPGFEPAAASPPVRQLAVAIERAVGGDLRQLTIQLSPEALGNIEIALEFDAERRLGVVILAERPETLELLRGEARQLERLLGQQGLASDKTDLAFGLMGGSRDDRPAPDGRPRGGVVLRDGLADEGGADPTGGEDATGSTGMPGPHTSARRLNLSI